MSDSGDGFRAGTRGEARRLAIIALCVLALIVAAFAFPATLGDPSSQTSPSGEQGEQAGGNGPQRETPDGGGGGASGGTGSGEGSANDTSGTTNVTDGTGSGGDGSGGGSIVTGPGGAGGSDGELSSAEAREIAGSGCLVLLANAPKPGARVPVYVIEDGEPAGGVTVWFDGEPIGQTDARGRVVGRVPYSRPLSVSVSMPGVDSCRFETPSSLAEGTGSSALGNVGSTRHAGTVGGTGPLWDTTTAGDSAAVTAMGQSDPSGEIPVEGSVSIGIRGEPYPGETVTLVAAVEGVPMRQAAVRVDGQRVGRTGVDGTYQLRVPDDGGEQVSVAVERGDFAGTGTIDIATLDIAITSDSLLTIPGQTVTATVTVDGEPVASAPLALDGRRVGTTDRQGEVELAAPADPTATATVSYRGMTATAGVWVLYVPLVFAILLAFAVLVAVTWRYGRRRGALAGAAVGAVTVAHAAYRIDGARGLALAVAAMTLLTVAAWASTNRREVAEGATDAGGTLAAFVEWLATSALRAVGAIERLLAHVRISAHQFSAWLASTPRSLGGIVAAVATAIASFVRGVPRAVVGLLGWLVRLPFAIVAAIRDAPKRTESRDETAEESTGGVATESSGASNEDPSKITLREAWRRFARRVAARNWRRRTPGEVARDALDQGFPREPVLVLTDVFRDVEYGERPPEEDRIERAREAFEAIDADQRGEREAGD